MTLAGTAGKVAILAVLFFTAAFFSWKHFHTRAQQMQRSFEPFVSARTLPDPSRAENADQIVKWIKQDREMQAERSLLDWRHYNGFGRQLRYPMFAWLLFFVGLATLFLNRRWLAWLAPVCVALEGIAFGSLEILAEQRFPGLTLIALMITAGLMLSVLVAFGIGLVDDTNPFRLGATGVVGAIAFSYLATAALRFFGYPVEFLHSGPDTWRIFVPLVLAVETALCLFVCRKIRTAIDAGAPQWLEWEAALRIFISFIELARGIGWLLKSRSREAWCQK